MTEGKIRIKESKTADTRSATTKVTKDILLESSKQHIEDVQKAITFMMDILLAKASNHDFTKIDNIDEFYNDFHFIQDGNVGEFLKMNWYQNFHLKKERHHLLQAVPENVNLFDVFEMIADCTVAGMARTGKIFPMKLSSEILEKAFQNTVKLISENIIVEKEEL